MSHAMTGKTFTPGERKQEFCVAAKLCAGKASSRDQAIEICKNRPPKEPKERKVHTPKQCNARMLKLARCVAENIDMDQVGNVNSFEMAVANALLKCECNEV